MRSTRWGRSAALLGGVLLLLLAPLVPASATDKVSMVFAGTLTTGPKGVMCVGPGMTLDTTTCPALGSSSGTATLYPATGGSTSVNAPIGGNSTGFVFSSTLCVGTGETVGKTGKSPVIGPTCGVNGIGSFTGSCGAETGRGTGNAALTGVGFNSYTFEFSMVISGADWTMTGRATKGGRNGPLFGKGKIFPVPGTAGTTTTNSCVSRTAGNFTMLGEIDFLVPTVL